MNKGQLLKKRFTKLAGEKCKKTILIDISLLTVSRINLELYDFANFPEFDKPDNWAEISSTEKSLYIIDNSQYARDWIRSVEIVRG